MAVAVVAGGWWLVEVVVVVGGEVAAMACGRWLWEACGCKILQLFCRLSSSVVD